jgi:hypothetical protein
LELADAVRGAAQVMVLASGIEQEAEEELPEEQQKRVRGGR